MGELHDLMPMRDRDHHEALLYAPLPEQFQRFLSLFVCELLVCNSAVVPDKRRRLLLSVAARRLLHQPVNVSSQTILPVAVHAHRNIPELPLRGAWAPYLVA